MRNPFKPKPKHLPLVEQRKAEGCPTPYNDRSLLERIAKARAEGEADRLRGSRPAGIGINEEGDATDD